MGKSVLLIDDNQRAQRLVGEIASRLNPHGRFYSVDDGGAGVDHLERSAAGEVPAVDLVLVDRQMRHLDGFATLERLRRMPALRALPIIMVTGSNERAHIQRARTSGASDYYVKPAEEHAWTPWLRDLLLWRPEFAQWGRTPVFEHQPSTVAASTNSQGLTPSLSLAAMPEGSLSLPQHPVAQFLATAAAYLRRPDFDATAMVGLFADPDEMDITFAERQARVTRRQVEDLERHSGQDMDRKRRRFFLVLFQRDWTLSQVAERWPFFGHDYFKRIRAEMNKSSTDRAPSI